MDLKLLKAASFVKRALESTDLKQKLLCIYDGFVCVFGPADACNKAAEASGLDVSYLKKAIDFCMDSGDAPSEGAAETNCVEINEELVGKLFNALKSLVGKI